MNRFQTMAVIGLASLATMTIAQQSEPTPGSVTPPPAQSTQTDGAPLTKSEMKEQKKQQKHQEKAAKEQAKAQKSNADALKHADKAKDEQEKVQSQTPQ
jgi:hypothetical protein